MRVKQEFGIHSSAEATVATVERSNARLISGAKEAGQHDASVLIEDEAEGCCSLNNI